MTSGAGAIGKLVFLGRVALVILTGLCTAFAAVATAAQAWQEHVRARWPVVTAHVGLCSMEQRSFGWKRYHIHCRLNYVVGAENNVLNVYSRFVPPANAAQYPANQIAPYEVWLEEYPPGTPILLHYDPDQPAKAVLAGNYPPLGGPHTASNLKLLTFFAGIFLVLLTLARATWPRFRGLRASS
jgi:hypothetical protein